MKIEEMDLNTFLNRNNITEEDFKKCSLDWKLIQTIGADHQSKISNLEISLSLTPRPFSVLIKFTQFAGE